MKSYLVDVPVMINIWKRPKLQKKTFAAVKEARPSKLFLISDGPRNEEERKKIMESRAIVEDVDWECEIHKLYFDDNQGMYATIFKELEFVFSHVDRCIFLEDDVLPSVSFFRFCAELLEKYKDDLRITAINGMNYSGKWRDKEVDYFFTHGNGILGGAMWKRTYDLHFDKKVFNNPSLNRELVNYVKYSKGDFIVAAVERNLKEYSKDPFAGNHPPAVEFYRSFINVTQSQLDIVPSVNMVTNLGAEDGTHSGDLRLLPKRIQSLFYQLRYEKDFPLRHPIYVIRDKEYEQSLKVSRIERILDGIEVLLRNVIYLPPKEFVAKIKRKIMNKKLKNVEK